MRILLTNDDGYTSQGITFLADSLRKAGHRVFLVAPDKNRSGCSHSIDFLNDPIMLRETETDSWSCSGTPVDCIIVSLLGGIRELDITDGQQDGSFLYKAPENPNVPDLILSGINKGANLGTDIIYSGTASAARQGSFFGIPSIALSLVENGEKWHWDPVILYITDNLNLFMGYWKPGSFVNINFPNMEKKPLSLVPVFPSIRYYNDRIVTFASPQGGVYCFAKPGKVDNEPETGSDWAEVRKGNAALSLITAQPQVV